MDSHGFLRALTIVLCTAGVTTVLCQKLRLPVVLGYIVAGLIVGPHVPIPLVADREAVALVSELGVILLMFALGLEFSLQKLVKIGATAGVTAVVQSSIMVWLGYMAGRAFGWTPRESIFAGAIIAISSTTIIAKVFDEQRVKGSLRELVVGVLVIEDLIGILLMAILTALASGDEMSASVLWKSGGRLAAFLAGLVIVGLLIVPRMMRAVVSFQRAETTLVASIGVCFAGALLAHEFGYSVALGAFIAGSLVAESGHEKEIEHLIVPVRDMFGAVFFVSVGMMIDPRLVMVHWLAIVVLTVIVIVGKVVGVSLGAFLTGQSARTSIQAGMSLAQIGEFSFIIAGLGISLDATGNFLYPIAVAVSAITTLTTPWLIQNSDRAASFVDRKLPKPLQTFAALYASWLENARTAPPRKTAGASARRFALLLALDAALLAAIVIGAAVFYERISESLSSQFGLAAGVSKVSVVISATALATPFAIGIVRISRRLATTLADASMPSPDGSRMDRAAAPRRALVVTLQIAAILVVALLLLAVTQPFLPSVPATLALLVLLAVSGFAFWRGATNLHGHVRAGAQMFGEALAAHAREGAPTHGVRPLDHALDEAKQLLPGLGEPTPVLVAPGSPCVGRTLGELKLRGRTGATVLAIRRGSASIVVPSAREVIQVGDIVVLAGSQESVIAASALVCDAGAVEPAEKSDSGA
ncbi:MAG: cation:proton antiporter [Planctomycetota bacterium]